MRFYDNVGFHSVEAHDRRNYTSPETELVCDETLDALVTTFFD